MTGCPVRDMTDDEVPAWRCWKEEGHEGRHAPKLSEEAIEFILDADCLNTALFHVADMFKVPATNNGAGWLEADGEPVFEIGDFIGIVRDAVKKFKEEL